MPQDSDMPTTPGGRIALLLERSDVDPQQLADHMLLPDGVTLADVVSDDYEPSLSELLAAADVLDVPVMMLTGKIPMDGHLGVSLRLGTIDGAGISKDLLAYADMLLRHHALLDAWHGPIENRLKDVPLSLDSYGKKAGRVSADRVRVVLGAGDEPIGDLAGLIESLGIPVAFQDLPEGVHGLNVRDQRQGSTARVIIISTRDRWARQRYTLAHELCHAIYDDAGQVIVDTVAEPEAVPEYRAESFARHLLLPYRALRDEVIRARRLGASWRNLVPTLMARYGVSRDAVLNALIDDHFADEADLADIRQANVGSILHGAGLDGEWARLEEGQNQASGSVSLVERAISAFANGWIDATVVADLMGDRVEHVRSMLTTAGWNPRGADA